MGIAEGITAARAAMDVIKSILDLTRHPKLDAKEIYNQLLQLQGHILSAQTALSEVYDENRALKAQLQKDEHNKELEKLMVYDQSVLWKRSGANGELEPHPYCTVCWEKERRLSHLRPGATRGVYSCQIDGSSYTTDEYRPSSRTLHTLAKFRT